MLLLKFTIAEPAELRVEEHLKRNLCLAAEPSEGKQLAHNAINAVAHATRPVDEHDHAVLLALVLHEVTQEDIVMGLELVQTIRVDRPGRLHALLADLLRSLAAFKLGNQFTHRASGFLAELLQAGVCVLNRRREHIGIVTVARRTIVLCRNSHSGTAVDEEIVEGNDRLAAVALGQRVREMRVVLVAQIGNLVCLLKIAVLLHRLHGIGQVSNGVTIPVHRTSATLLLVLLRLHGVEFIGKCHDIIERLGCGNPVDERLFSIVDRNVHQTEQTELEVQVDLINDGQVIHVERLQLEQIGVKDLLIPRIEVAAATGKLLLDATLNTSILNDIDASLVAVSVQLATLR